MGAVTVCYCRDGHYYCVTVEMSAIGEGTEKKDGGLKLLN